jgi:TM2 domain-containing membrane protein YozV
MTSPTSPTTPSVKFCQSCGKSIYERAEICPMCGVRQPMLYAPPFGSEVRGRYNRGLAAVFALLLGGFGVHKFYLGKVGQGLLYLVFCWTFIPTIVGFIEGIIYLTKSDEQFAAEYG